MICTIPTLEEAHKIMDEALEACGKLESFWYDQLAFDLSEDLDPNDVPCSISRCEDCKRTIRFDLGDDNEDICHYCGGIMKELVVVSLVIQGSVVVSTNWREPMAW